MASVDGTVVCNPEIMLGKSIINGTRITVEQIVQYITAGISVEDILTCNRTTTLLGHFASIGSNLKAAVTNYNHAVASLESRFVPAAKKLYSLGSAYTKHAVPDIKKVELVPRDIEVISPTTPEPSQAPPID
jgi:hypothetical protein